MEFNRQVMRLTTGLVAIALGLAACRGASPTSPQYVPSGTSGISSSQLHLAVSPAAGEHGELISTCGKHIKVTIAGIVSCHFREGGIVRKDIFTLHDHTNGLILISPTSGGRATKFTITGLVLGTGYFTVNDDKDSLRITVRVTL